MSLLAGDEALVAGAEVTGIVSAIVLALPELPVALYRALKGGEIERSEELRRTIEELRIRLAPFPSVMALKQAAIARGWIKGPFAVPPDGAMERTKPSKNGLRGGCLAFSRNVRQKDNVTSSFERLESRELRAMTPEEFRQAAYAHADWIANYFAHVRDYPVESRLEPGDLITALPQQAPEAGEPIEQILLDFESTIFPSLTLWNHPRFFPWFSVSSTPPSILADLMISAMNVNAMLWKSSPGATELEQVTLSWLRQWLGLPEEWFGIIYDTASVGVMQAIGAAREWIDPESRTRGARAGLTVYVSEQAHNSAEKSAITLGFGQENVRRIAVDAEFRMRADLLEQAIERDIQAEATMLHCGVYRSYARIVY